MAGKLTAHPAVLALYNQRVKLEKRGNEFLGLCPFHDDHHPSLTIRMGESGDWVYFCFSCSAAGDCIDFIRKKDGISFSAAKKILEDATQGNWEESRAAVDAVFQKMEMVPAEEVPLEKFAKFEIGLYESKEAQEWLFRERGITYDAARRLHFGYCQNLDAVTTKYNREELKDIADKGWIVFPAIQDNKILCIEARSVVQKVTRMRTGMSNKVLFGVDQIVADSPIYVVEGKLDQAIMVQAGYNCVSLPNASASLTPEMRDSLMTAPVRILSGDTDAAGSSKLSKLWQELQTATYMIKWPEGCKDANETFLKVANREISVFRSMVDRMVLDAYARPLPGLQSIQDILEGNDSQSSDEREDRFVSSVPAVDRMANIFPGAVVYISASQTGVGKSQWVLQETLNAARKKGLTVVNYQTQMEGEEVGEIIAANVLAKPRDEIKRLDRIDAAKKLRDVQYYIGHNPDLRTADDVLDLVEAAIRRLGAHIAVIDLIHDICEGAENEIRAQTKAMRRFKLMMQKYRCIGFIIGQPRKVDQKRQGKALQIYDSKGSETIPSESDVVFYLHREPVKNVTEETQDKLSPECEIHRMKARNQGKGGAMVKLFFLGKIATFREIVPIEEPMTQGSLEF